MKRDKATIIKSGVDPELKELRKLQAIKSGQEKKFVKSLERIEDYWDRVFAAVAAAE
jgi:hypothetical protein